MKALWILILAIPLMAAEPGETEWYDSEGKLVLVEGPDAVPAEVPFVAEWRQREIDRRARYQGEWSSEIWPVWGGNGYPRRWNYPYRYGRNFGFYPKTRFYGGYFRSCPTPYRGGASVIIRW
ncbi:hypothetical protein [Haloferula sp.]|uniref:hypothetical protein n=1 Tax=Haloferula sp. TaxID=2497595 RepID=UPI003C72DA0D